MSSILDDVKHMLGILPSETAFDGDVLIHINSVFSILHNIGAGPSGGFQIINSSTSWEEYITDYRLNDVKSYMFLRVKLFFDPPQIGFVISSMDRQITELEYRINLAAENPTFGEGVILDGGGA